VSWSKSLMLCLDVLDEHGLRILYICVGQMTLMAFRVGHLTPASQASLPGTKKCAQEQGVKFLIHVLLTSTNSVYISGLTFTKHCAFNLIVPFKRTLKPMLRFCVCTWKSSVCCSSFCLVTLVRHSTGGHVTCSLLLGLPTNIEIFIIIAKVCRRRVVSCRVFAHKKGLPCWS